MRTFAVDLLHVGSCLRATFWPSLHHESNWPQLQSMSSGPIAECPGALPPRAPDLLPRRVSPCQRGECQVEEEVVDHKVEEEELAVSEDAKDGQAGPSEKERVEPEVETVEQEVGDGWVGASPAAGPFVIICFMCALRMSHVWWHGGGCL